MSAKKRSTPVEKELKSTIKRLRADLERADARADGWKKKAGLLKKSAAASEAKVKKLKKLNKRLEKAPRAAEMPDDAILHGTSIVAATSPSADGPLPAVSSHTAARPDASWTVVRLRAEARSRGKVGLARKSKAELLAALT